MTLQYLEALKALGASPSTKFVIPIEFTRLAEPIGDYVAPARQGRRAGPRRAAVRAGTPARHVPEDPARAR